MMSAESVGSPASEREPASCIRSILRLRVDAQWKEVEKNLMNSERTKPLSSRSLPFVVVAAVLATSPVPVAADVPLGTSFAYQGFLEQGGDRVHDECDFQFSLFDDPAEGVQVGATQTLNAVDVINGIFTVQIDFGEGAIIGTARFLEIAVRCPSGSGDFVTLIPRQELTPTPHALALPGLWTQQNEISPNLIGGFSGNIVAEDVVGATISGGGDDSSVNRVTDDFGTVGGGAENRAGNAAGPPTDATYTTVAGGFRNTASGARSTVGGGFLNTASGNTATVGGGSTNRATSFGSTIGGGLTNTAGQQATIGGGSNNAASAFLSTIGGGSGNQTRGNFATIGGGEANTASGELATIGGGKINFATDSSATVGGGLGNRASGLTLHR